MVFILDVLLIDCLVDDALTLWKTCIYFDLQIMLDLQHF